VASSWFLYSSVIRTMHGPAHITLHDWSRDYDVD